MLDLREYRTRRVLLADYLPWAGLVALGLVLNKDGSLQRTCRYRGPDLEARPMPSSSPSVPGSTTR
jgi:type IV secretion system protein VirB4